MTTWTCLFTSLLLGIGSLSLPSPHAWAESGDTLHDQILELEVKLADMRAALSHSRSQIARLLDSTTDSEGDDTETSNNDPPALENKAAAQDPSSDKIRFHDPFGGVLHVGGAIRVNYSVGSYGPQTSGPSRAQRDYGNFSLGLFRGNFNYVNGSVVSSVEYRFYDGFHFLHSG